jgi:hypothetical protein
MGLSGMGGEGPSRIPTPAHNFTAVVVDRADVRTTVNMFSIGGFTYFFGKIGKGQVAVPFQKVVRADFSLKPEGLVGLLSLKDGQKVAVMLNRRQNCFGRTSIGNFQIRLDDIKMLTLQGEIPTE